MTSCAKRAMLSRPRVISAFIVLLLVQLVVAHSLNLFPRLILFDFYQYWGVSVARRVSGATLGNPYSNSRGYHAALSDYAAASGDPRLTALHRISARPGFTATPFLYMLLGVLPADYSRAATLFHVLQVVLFVGAVILLGALFVTAACSLDDPELPLGLEISVDKVVLTLNDSIRIALTATNYGDTPIALSGPSDCLLFFDVRNTTGASVFGSHQNCVGATVTETIPAGRNREAVFTWHGRNSAGVRLPPGFYGISALALVAGGTRRGASAAIQIE